MLRLHVWMSTLFHKSRNGNITRSDLVRSCLTCLSQRSPNFMQAYTKLQHRDLGHCYLQRASPWAVVCAFVSWILQVTQVNKEQDCMENALNSYKEHYRSKWAMCECQIDEHNNGVHLTHTHTDTHWTYFYTPTRVDSQPLCSGQVLQPGQQRMQLGHAGQCHPHGGQQSLWISN